MLRSLLYSLLAAGLYAGSASAECPAGSESLGSKDVGTSVNAPHEAKLNLSEIVWQFPKKPLANVRQASGKVSGGSASPVMTLKDVPIGFIILARGTQDNCKGWAIHKPILKNSGNNQIFMTKAYCHSGSDHFCMQPVNGCGVTVELCRFVGK